MSKTIHDPGAHCAPLPIIRDITLHCAPLFIRQKQVLRLVPFSAATLWRKVKEGTFVQPVKLSARVTAWRVSDIDAWLTAQEAGGAK